MPPVSIPWPLSTSPGRKPQEGAGRLINAFAIPIGEQRGVVYHRIPGSLALGLTEIPSTTPWTWQSVGTEWFNTANPPLVPTEPFRGGIFVNDIIYGAFGESIYTVDVGGNYLLVGPLAGTDRVYFARNNNAIPQIVAVCAAGAFLVTATSVSAYPDADVGAPNSVAFHDSYFMFTYGSGKVQASAVNDTGINTLDSATAESNTDGLLRAISYQGQLYLFGQQTVEVWGEPINAVAFPLTRVGYNITPGLNNAAAIAGFEPEFGHPPIWAASDHTVRQLDGYTAKSISPPELDALIAAVPGTHPLEACCYTVDGIPFWELSSPTWSWVYNLNTQKWHEHPSYLALRSRYTNDVFAFNDWLVGDTNSGYLLHLSSDLYTEAGDPLVFMVESQPVKDFPNRVRVSRADFDFAAGYGLATGEDPIQTDPKVMIWYSDDGGVYWKGPYERKLGRQQETQQRVILPPTGMSGPVGRRWRVSVSDPVHVGLLGGSMEAAPMRK